jgi:hypothetical protein
MGESWYLLLLCFFSNVVSSWALGKWQAQEILWRRGWSLCFFSNVVSSWALGKWQAQEILSSFFGLEHEK